MKFSIIAAYFAWKHLHVVVTKCTFIPGVLNIEINICIAEDNTLILTPQLNGSQSSWWHIKGIKYAMLGEAYSQFPPKIHPENRVSHGVTRSFLSDLGV